MAVGTVMTYELCARGTPSVRHRLAQLAVIGLHMINRPRACECRLPVRQLYRYSHWIPGQAAHSRATAHPSSSPHRHTPAPLIFRLHLHTPFHPAEALHRHRVQWLKVRATCLPDCVYVVGRWHPDRLPCGVPTPMPSEAATRPRLTLRW